MLSLAFYHVGGVNYDLNRPATISFCPTGETLDKMRADYEAMMSTMIYGDKLPFYTLIAKLEELQTRFRAICDNIIKKIDNDRQFQHIYQPD